MIAKILLFLVLSVTLFAQNSSWYGGIETQVEVGLYMPNESGSISNLKSTADFETDLGFSKTQASYFSVEAKGIYTYVPNIFISYFNMRESASATPGKTITVADVDFNASVASQIQYQTFHFVVYQDFKIKGDMFSFWNTQYYSGDIEFDLGLDIKYEDWYYEIQDLGDVTKAPSWISVKEFVPLPFFGVRYYLYDWRVYGRVSALAFNRSKTNTFDVGVDYGVTENIFIHGGYLYEWFEVDEDNDKISYTTRGYKVSLKYSF